MTPRLVVFAYSDLGTACLEKLIKRGENIAAVYTHADKAGEKIWFPSVAKLAASKKIPVRRDADLKSAKELAALRKLSPELIFSFYFREIIPNEVLALPRLGAYNMHGSYLPKYRGRAPVNWAILNGETFTGATLHVMTERADAGDIIDQEKVPIGPDDTAVQVQKRVTAAAVKVLERQIEPLKQGKAPRIPQDDAKATKYGRRRPEDGRIDWDRPAPVIHNLIRAVTRPFPGAYDDKPDGKTYIWASRLAMGKSLGLTPGQYKRVNGRLYVGCGGGSCLQILKKSSSKGEK